MKRICKRCGREISDDRAKYCDCCGAPLEEDGRASACWRSDENPYLSLDANPSPETAEEKRKRKLTRAFARKKKLFVLAFVGLLLDFIVGVGWFLCLPVAILATTDSRLICEEKKKLTTWHLWAMTIGYLGALFGLVFFLLIV